MTEETTQEGHPLYNRALGVAGYDPETSRWRDGDGRFRSREEILGSPRTAALAGRAVEMPSYAKASALAERMEHIISGVDSRTLRDYETGTDPMPGAVLAMMRLSEYYMRTEGDVFQTVEVPLDIALKPLDFSSPDSGFQDALEELYSEQYLDMWQNLYYFWMCSAIYGQAFPLELIDEGNVQDSKLLLIPPKNVDVGRSFILGSNMSVRPFGSSDEWSQDLFEATFPEMAYNRRAVDFNESIPAGWQVIINPERCYPIREKSLPFQRYAIPPIVRASRAIATRRVFEEMRRATVEGYKNQLWLFLLGDAENMPLPEEIEHLGDAVAGLQGERTGALVWTGNLKVEVLAPQAPDRMMANETAVGLTMEVFRRLGISLKMVSGEHGPLGGGRATVGDVDLDLGILLERLTFRVNQMYRWERQFRRKVVQLMGNAAVKANKKTEVRFGHIGLQVERDIREKLLPTYQAGILSIETYLDRGGWEWLIELQRKKDEEKYRELFSPPASFAQQVVKESGEVDKEVRQTPSRGRPRDDNRNLPKKAADEVKAGLYFQAAADFSAYVADVYGVFDRMLEDRSIDAVTEFISRLKDINRERMYEFALDGYNAGGGTLPDPDGLREWTDGAIHFVNSYTDGFSDRLIGMVDDPVALEGSRWNAYLYPQEGRHLAYMYGMQWAMRERGAKGWRRVLHPELSTTGPCEMCIADSTIVHGIDEAFFEFHPNGVCSEQGVAFYTDQQFPTLEVPVPRKVFDPGRILEILKNLGLKVQQIIRRVRGE